MNIIMLSVLVISLSSSLVFTYLMSKLGLYTPLVGYDAFKPAHPRISALGGSAIILASILSIGYASYMKIIPIHYAWGILSSILIVFLIGLIDDIKPNLPGYYKPLAAALGGIPIIIFKIYRPVLNIFGGITFRLTIIYPILIIIAFSIVLNTVNMLDVINGSAATGVLFSLLVSATLYYVKVHEICVPCLLFLSIVIGFLFFNRYPAKIFLGNSGALVLGAFVVISAIVTKTEFPVLISMMPFIHNSFFYLNKVKSFIEHKKLEGRVTIFDEDTALIYDACDDRAPLTLLRFMVSVCPKRELDLYYLISILFLFSSILAVITYILGDFIA